MTGALVIVDTIWTQFWDMHSGGRTKVVIDGVDVNTIYIEAPEERAVEVFQERFGRDPRNTTCDCCGGDYSLNEGPLRRISAYHRNAKYSEEADGYIEEREDRHDRIILDIVGRNLSSFDKRTQDLYRMAKDKGSPKEAAVAREKLVLSKVGIKGNWWNPKPLIPFDEFLKVPKHGNGWCLLIRKEDF